MEMLGKIRRMHLRDGLSLHEITKRTGLSRNTVRSWLRSPEESAPPTYRRNEGPSKLTAFHAALEQALKADAHRAKQDRRSAKAKQSAVWWPASDSVKTPSRSVRQSATRQARCLE